MVFADLFFLYFFLPICLICYFVSKKLQYRNIVLVAFSLVFYAWGEPLWVFLLVFSSFVNYLLGLVIGSQRGKPLAKTALIIAITYNIATLGVFKYSGFIAENINNLLHTSFKEPSITLPIGISFYTFQILSYVIDCYWGKVKSQKSFTKFLMYVSLFPQLVAGPIVRYADIEREIDNRKTKLSDVSEGFTRVIIGIAKKVIIANNLNTIVTLCFGQASDGYSGLESLSVVGTWYGAIAVALWYYFDFSGYSDIAIGLGRIFGFHFNENFKHPFICRSITEFWQRWHISLGSFFRDYLLYLPIFGKRRKYGGLFLVWFCTGLWHGASWNFIIWGLYYGLFIVLEMQIGKKRMKNMNTVMAHIYTKLVIVIGFGIFCFENFASLGKFFKSLIGLNGNSFIDQVTKTNLANYIILVAVAILLSMPVIEKIKSIASKKQSTYLIVSSAGIVCNLALLIISSLLLLNSTNNPFLYFRF